MMKKNKNLQMLFISQCLAISYFPFFSFPSFISLVPVWLMEQDFLSVLQKTTYIELLNWKGGKSEELRGREFDWSSILTVWLPIDLPKWDTIGWLMLVSFEFTKNKINLFHLQLNLIFGKSLDNYGDTEVFMVIIDNNRCKYILLFNVCPQCFLCCSKY